MKNRFTVQSVIYHVIYPLERFDRIITWDLWELISQEVRFMRKVTLVRCCWIITASTPQSIAFNCDCNSCHSTINLCSNKRIGYFWHTHVSRWCFLFRTSPTSFMHRLTKHHVFWKIGSCVTGAARPWRWIKDYRCRVGKDKQFWKHWGRKVSEIGKHWPGN